jgi:hypothetical protein
MDSGHLDLIRGLATLALSKDPRSEGFDPVDHQGATDGVDEI